MKWMICCSTWLIVQRLGVLGLGLRVQALGAKPYFSVNVDRRGVFANLRQYCILVPWIDSNAPAEMIFFATRLHFRFNRCPKHLRARCVMDSCFGVA